MIAGSCIAHAGSKPNTWRNQFYLRYGITVSIHEELIIYRQRLTWELAFLKIATTEQSEKIQDKINLLTAKIAELEDTIIDDGHGPIIFV